MRTKCNECGEPRQDMEDLHCSYCCPYCNERKKIRTELFIKNKANGILTRELARVKAACEVMRNALLTFKAGLELSEITATPGSLSCLKALQRADKILGGGE